MKPAPLIISCQYPSVSHDRLSRHDSLGAGTGHRHETRGVEESSIIIIIIISSSSSSSSR